VKAGCGSLGWVACTPSPYGLLDASFFEQKARIVCNQCKVNQRYTVKVKLLPYILRECRRARFGTLPEVGNFSVKLLPRALLPSFLKDQGTSKRLKLLNYKITE
jgi:hypothetical protein